eukprot:SAG11_NODE_27258_length_334_cov_10.782979_1_plen_23_part_10
MPLTDIAPKCEPGLWAANQPDQV